MGRLYLQVFSKRDNPVGAVRIARGDGRSEVGKAFADRWGVPVRSGSAEAVARLDAAIEDLAALAGDPVADAEAAVAADDSLVLGHIYRAYLALYGTGT